nr:histidine--tRNA ligase, cytoplasmic [Tanacetum cinerariifolium]
MVLDTPVFELRETLTEKYGEDSKLIYDLADKLCSLRYDLTVPFVRYVAMNRITSFRGYQMGKVYRRNEPSKGRYREFYQCDFDIAGDESIGVAFEVIKLNHQKLVDGMLDICGVPSNKFRTVCSSTDKLDRQMFEQIKKELIDEKGLDTETVEKIGSFVKLRVGSIAGGGRYDDLIGMFLSKPVAAIGVSVGIECVFTIMEQNQKDDKQDLSLAAKLVNKCWRANLKASFLVNKRVSKHLDRAKEFGIPWIVMVGELETSRGVVTLKNKDAGVEKKVHGSDFVEELASLINNRQC